MHVNTQIFFMLITFPCVLLSPPGTSRHQGLHVWFSEWHLLYITLPAPGPGEDPASDSAHGTARVSKADLEAWHSVRIALSFLKPF